MGQQQLLLVILGAILVAFAIAIGLTLFSAQAIQANKTAIFNDINQIAAYANHFRVTTTSMGGGQGSFAGFKIPVTMTSPTWSDSQSPFSSIFESLSSRDCWHADWR